jgi:hypothetical protein
MTNSRNVRSFYQYSCMRSRKHARDFASQLKLSVDVTDREADKHLGAGHNAGFQLRSLKPPLLGARIQ